jgi:CBS domain containing-hemolysin-like protein
VLGLLALALFIALNGFFVAAEFSLVKLRATFQGAKPAKNDMVGQAVEKIDRYLSVTQLGITLASLGLGWLGEPALAAVVTGAFEKVTGKPPQGAVHTAVDVVAFSLLTYGHVLFGELVPKLIAIQKSMEVARLSVWPLRIAYYALFPGLWVLETSSRAILARFGLSLDAHGEGALSEDEILGILAAHVARGHGAADKQELIKRMMRFSQRTARQAMIPRVDVFYLPVSTPGRKAIEQLRAQEFSRVPLSKEQEIDQIVGYLYWKDIVREERSAELPNLERLKRDVLFVPSSQALVNVLREMQRTRTPFAVVVDEYGGTAGIITMEDLLEEIVGEIRDESDVEPLRIEKRGDVWEADGAVMLDELESSGMDVGEHEGQTSIGGAVLGSLGRIPRLGDVVELGRCKFEVIALARRRVVRVRITVKELPIEELGQGSGECAWGSGW